MKDALLSPILGLSSDFRRLDAWAPPGPNNADAFATCTVLTELLRYTPEFGRSLLPARRHAVTKINQAVRARGFFVPPSRTTREHRMHSRVGTTVERAALHLLGQDIVTTPLTFLRNLSQPRNQVFRFYSQGRVTRGDLASLAAILTIHAATETLGELHPDPATIGWLLVLAGLQPTIKSCIPLSEWDFLDLPRGPVTKRKADAWLRSRIPNDLASELGQLLDSIAHALPRGRVTPSPSFGGWGRIGDAQGDLLVDHCLIELKCTITGVRSAYLTQLLCYAAIDALNDRTTSPRFSIQELAVVLPRQRCRISGPVDDWLAAFGAPPFAVFLNGFARFWNSFGHGTHTGLYPPLPWASAARGA